MVLSILVDREDTDTVFVGFGGYSENNIYKTVDGGATWVDISGNLPNSPIRTIQKHPDNSEWLYVGTEVGVFTSENGGITWTTSNDGPANVAVDQLFWLDSSTLVAATHGRGMFKVTVANGTSSLMAPVQTYPNRLISTKEPWFYWRPLDSFSHYEVQLLKGNQVVAKKLIPRTSANCDNTNCWFQFDKEFAAGNYMWRLRAHDNGRASSWNTMAFTIDPSQKPATAKLLGPKGNINARKPLFRWRRAARTTYYRLWVSDDSLSGDFASKAYSNWFSSESLGCVQGTTCQLNLPVQLPTGSHRWWVQTWNPTGYGEWSKAMDFVITTE